jgi:parvulin-like peptidyl-prolyl isomerase
MKRYFLVVFTLLSGMVFAQDFQDLQPVAVVRLSKSQPVSVKEFKDYVRWINLSRANVAAQYGQPTPAPLDAEERRQILETITNQLLACQAAEQDNVAVTDRELNQAVDEELKPLIEALSQRLSRTPSDAEIDNELRTRTGMTRAGFREQIRRSLLTDKYLYFKKQALLQSVSPPSDAEIQNLYNQGKDKLFLEGGFFRPDTIRIRMIAVRATGQASRAAALERANQLVRQIGGDAGKFDEVMADSRKPNSGYEVGDTYLYKDERFRVNVGIDFFDTAFGLKQGQVSKLLERPDGYYIIKVIETLRQKILTLEDVYLYDNDSKPVTVKNYIIITESQRRQVEVREKASIELVEELKKRGSVQVVDATYNSIVW